MWYLISPWESNTPPTQGTCPVLQHCSGITTFVQFSFRHYLAVVTIQRYRRCAADWGSGRIAHRNAAVEVCHWNESRRAFQKQIGQHPEAPCQGASGYCQIRFWNPPGQLWHHQDGGQAGDSQPNDTIMFESKIAITAIISTGSIMNEIKYYQNLIQCVLTRQTYLIVFIFRMSWSWPPE